MNKQNIIDNWDIYYKSYLDLNPDLVLAGINSKRAALNHYIKYGYNEGRKIVNTISEITTPQVIISTQNQSLNLNNVTYENEKIYLEERMIIEKLDLNV
jgi:hypothetical protein